jgi:transposase InsO family protein
MVQTIRMEMPRLGTRKLHYLLKGQFESQNIKIGRDALFGYLRKENMLITRKKNYTKTTDSKHWLKKYPNLYKTMELKRPEEAFVSDITYLKTKERTYYLSLVTDAYSRKIMGYNLSDNMNSENVLKALNMAVRQRDYSWQLVHHSDRGLQYAAELYQSKLRKEEILPSMTDGYDCYQNALAERINGILKEEFLFYKCNDINELESLVVESIDTYNNIRPHLSLGMKTPSFIHKKNSVSLGLRNN